MRERRHKRLKKKNIIIIICLIVVVSIVLIFIFKGKSSVKDKIIGEWTTDGVTIYEFKKDNTGLLKVSLSDYEFVYKIENNKLFIDFKNEKSEDSEYSYEFKYGELILNGKYGTFTFKRNK